MKTKTFSRAGAWVLCGAAVLAGPGRVGAADEGMNTEDRINHAVQEAQELAKQWAYRIQEWKSGEAKSTTYMGVVIESVPDVLRDYIDLPEGVGLLLVRISKDGPAAKAGLQDNDILVEFDNQLIVNYSQLSTLLDLKGPETTVPVKILRKGEAMMFDVTLEERVRQGGHFIHPEPPEPPEPPDVGAVPNPEDIGVWVGDIEEWIPGSVRVFIDKNEQVHVDLSDLKDNIEDLEDKLQYIHVLKNDIPGLVKEHGNMGARTTVVRVADKNINYTCSKGKVVLASSEAGQNAIVWDADGNLIYEGDLPEDYESQLPEKAVELIRSLRDSREKLHLGEGDNHIEIQLNRDEVEPVTWIPMSGSGE